MIASFRPAHFQSLPNLSDFVLPKDDILVEVTAKTDEVPAHLKADTPKPRAMHPRDQAKKLFRAGIFIEGVGLGG